MAFLLNVKKNAKLVLLSLLLDRSMAYNSGMLSMMTVRIFFITLVRHKGA